MAKRFSVQNKLWFELKPRKRTTFTGKKYRSRKKYRGQGR